MQSEIAFLPDNLQLPILMIIFWGNGAFLQLLFFKNNKKKVKINRPSLQM